MIYGVSPTGDDTEVLRHLCSINTICLMAGMEYQLSGHFVFLPSGIFTLSFKLLLDKRFTTLQYSV
jgi:hypothetical protein